MSFRTARPACESSQHPCCDSRAFAAVLHVFEKDVEDQDSVFSG
jgi:hypothetical protein